MTKICQFCDNAEKKQKRLRIDEISLFANGINKLAVDFARTGGSSRCSFKINGNDVPLSGLQTVDIKLDVKKSLLTFTYTI